MGIGAHAPYCCDDHHGFGGFNSRTSNHFAALSGSAVGPVYGRRTARSLPRNPVHRPEGKRRKRLRSPYTATTFAAQLGARMAAADINNRPNRDGHHIAGAGETLRWQHPKRPPPRV
jgi:hypothetical protein